jgi:UDP-N-acetyl-D-glucosamine dehydrogenase
MATKNESTRMAVGIVGLGYVGLPLAMVFCRRGIRVVGVDVSEERVREISAGRSPIGDVSDADVGRFIQNGLLKAATDYAALKAADSISICVPTPLRKTKDPDMSYVVAACEQLALVLQRGQLVILESTVYPGATEELVAQILEKSGLRAGVDFHLAFSPERVDPGNTSIGLAAIPKVVGGITPACTEKAVALYSRAFDRVVAVKTAREAEMAKLLENTFRAVNIGLVNELAVVSRKMGIDFWNVLEAAGTKPFGFMAFQPGPGLGGHCIPIDPFYLSWKAKMFGTDVGFIELADRVNSRMPAYVVERVAGMLNRSCKPVNGARIHVLGVAYKRNVSDVRESPAIDILGLFREMGAEVSYSDPHVPRLQVFGEALTSETLSPSFLRGLDCVVIVTDHSAFDWTEIVHHAPMVFDARNATGKLHMEAKNVERL